MTSIITRPNWALIRPPLSSSLSFLFSSLVHHRPRPSVRPSSLPPPRSHAHRACPRPLPAPSLLSLVAQWRHNPRSRFRLSRRPSALPPSAESRTPTMLFLPSSPALRLLNATALRPPTKTNIASPCPTTVPRSPHVSGPTQRTLLPVTITPRAQSECYPRVSPPRPLST